jgi:hypothetical protein
MIEVHFLHPRSSTTLTADVDLRCTGEEAIRELLRDAGTGRFIEPALTGEHYQLASGRTGQIIAPNMTFEQAGVVDGDTIEVRLAGQGGCFTSNLFNSTSEPEMIKTAT